MSGLSIPLTWPEVMIAAHIGCMRNVQSLRRPPGNNAGLDNTWTLNIEGAAGEMVVAKYFGRYWDGALGDLKAKDVSGYQVKTNTSRKYDDLILRPSDPNNGIYILVLSFLPEFTICGWISGINGKQQRWFREGTPGRPAFFVPRAALGPMQTCPVIIK